MEPRVQQKVGAEGLTPPIGRAHGEELEPKRCSRLLRVLADPERLRIIACLQEGPKNVSEIAEWLSRPIVTVSHHLSVLRQAGLVDDTRQGRFVIYQLHPDVYRTAEGAARLDLGCCRLEIPHDEAGGQR